MWARLFLLGACLLHSSRAADQEPRFMVTIPSLLKSDQTEKACLQLLYHEEQVTISVAVQLEGQNSSIFQGTAEANKPFSQCLNFKVPKIEKTILAYVTFSAQGTSINLQKNRQVVIQGFGSFAFIQTDKPVYRPEQTVMFRIVSLQQDFRPANETYPVVYIQDPDGNRIIQLDNVRSVHGIAQGEFTLDKEPILGTFSIHAQRQSGEMVYGWITVEQYVLPKIKMDVKVPKSLTITDENFTATVCAKYTYDEPVQGTVKTKVCRNNYRFYPEGTCSRYRGGICKEFTGPLGSDGCLQQTVDTLVFQMERSGLSMSFNIEATLTENGTGVQVVENAYVWISNQMTRLDFNYQSLKRYYKKNLNYTGQFTLLRADSTPLANETVELEANGVNVGNYTTGDDGSASFSVDTSKFSKSTVILTARYKKEEECNDDFWVRPQYPEATYYISSFYSPSGSFIQIENPHTEEFKCDTTASFKVSYVLNEKELGQDADSFALYYVVMARGEIQFNGEMPMSQGSSLTGFFDVNFPITSELAPTADLVVWSIYRKGEVMIDSVRFNVEGCLKNKASLNFSTPVAQPGSNVNVLLDAAADSFCAIRAMDQSVLLLRPEQELSARMLFYQVPLWEFYGYWHGGFDVSEPELTCVTPENIVVDGIEYTPISSFGEGDAYSIARDTGLKIFGNFELQKPKVCEKENKPGTGIYSSTSQSAEGFGGGGFDAADRGSKALFKAQSSVETVRDYFPETWLWTTQTVDANGKAQLSATIPDTITAWKANMFCMNEQVGIGISTPATLTAFLPFFVEPTLPYNIIRTEDFILKVNVFNYMESCIKVQTVLNPSEDFEVEPISKEEDNTGCFCGKDRKTVAWKFIAKVLGKVNITVTAEITHEGDSCSSLSSPPTTKRSDTVIRELLVEPEGIEKEVSQSSYICTKDAAVSTPIQIHLPDNLVEGSARGYCTVLGDIMGSTLQNIKNLVRMPYGCGEQNLITLVPNIVALDYLNATGQLTEEIKAEGIRNIQAGVQRHMQYRNWDGSYSIFRDRDSTAMGNAWLTAFSFMSFVQAAKYIFIDQNMQRQTEGAISNRQGTDGCFQNSGELFNNYLEGGVNSNTALTTYIAIAMLESNLSPQHPVVQGTLRCIEAVQDSTDDVYTESLMYYAATLAGKEDMRSALEVKLRAKAVTEDDMIHWERPDKPQSEVYPFFYPRAPSAEVEMTAYIVKSLLHQTPLSDDTLQYVTKVMRWLAKQLNSYGGFSSTQDTLVGVQALSNFASLTYTKNGSNQVSILFGDTVEQELQASDSNRLVVQKRELKNVPGNYTAEVSGNGCILLQTTVLYNIKLANNEPSFDLSVTSPNSCSEMSNKKFDLQVTISYTGSGNSSNMAVLDITLLTGFIAERSSLDELRRNRQISKTETPQGHAIFYMKKVTSEPISFTFSMERDYPVDNLQSRPAIIYDYYEKDKYAQVLYNAPCSEAESSS